MRSWCGMVSVGARPLIKGRNPSELRCVLEALTRARAHVAVPRDFQAYCACNSDQCGQSHIAMILRFPRPEMLPLSIVIPSNGVPDFLHGGSFLFLATIVLYCDPDFYLS
jgi:hypothetical protein